MSRSSLRDLFLTGLAVVLLAAVVGGGWFVIRARAAGGGATIEPAPVSPLPTPSPSDTASPKPPERQQWTVARTLGPVTVYEQPSRVARVRATLAAHARYGGDTVLLVRRVTEVGGDFWYDVWLPLPPNGSHGWVSARGLALYQVYSELVIDRQRRTLQVVRDGAAVATFRVAVGTADLPTPAGFFFVMEKVRPSEPNGAYGVLAIGISAFQPKLSYWAGGGQVAIHGTNMPGLIGRAVSHGCVRMTNHDILAVSRLVRIGSPVIIR